MKSKNEKSNIFIKWLVCFEFTSKTSNCTYRGFSSAKNLFGNLVLIVCDVRSLASIR